MSLLISGDLRLAKTWDLSGFDADAAAYIQRVEWADTTPLEAATRTAINSFVVGCKADGIWTAIKASCILSGARTLSGALMPLTGAAPTNVGGLFVSGDYNRKTGLVGDGSTKYLNSNRNNNADPQDSKHASVWVSTAATITTFGADLGIFGSGNGNTYIGRNAANAQIGANSALTTTLSSTVTGFRGIARSASANYLYRALAANNTIVAISGVPLNGNILIFNGISAGLHNNSRIAFYSIGESLDLALLDARVTTLINAFGAAIP